MRWLKEYIEHHGPLEFEPGWIYLPVGDEVCAFWSNEPYYAKWIKGAGITLYIGEDTQKVIGVSVHKVMDRIFLDLED